MFGREKKGKGNPLEYTLGYSGILWDTLGYSGILWDTLGYSGILWGSN